MIPKIIHYCWFGNAEKPKDVQEYIANWHEMLPDYEFIEWNESNCDINEIPYVKEAYEAKKYAFVSDYIRTKRMYEYGGVYFDTDIKVIRRFDDYIADKNLVMSFQGAGNLNTAFIAATEKNPMLGDLYDEYKTRKFVLEDGTMDTTSINKHLDAIAEKYGVNFQRDEYQEFAGNMAIYPTEFFCGFDVVLWCPDITKNTCTVHYMASSWRPMKVKVKLWILGVMYKIIGRKNYSNMRQFWKSVLKKYKKV